MDKMMKKGWDGNVQIDLTGRKKQHQPEDIDLTERKMELYKRYLHDHISNIFCIAI